MDYNKIKETDSKYYMQVFNRAPVAFTHGNGTKLYDTNGHEYTDFWSGFAVNCLGHNDPGLVAAISDQASKFIHISNIYYSGIQSEMIELLLKDSDFDRVFLSNSGAEANECAIKLVRKHFNSRKENRPTILTAANSFHGRTLATVTATGQPKYSAAFAPLPPGFKYIPYNDINALKCALTDDVGAIMLEIIQGEGGVVKIDYEYITMAYALCRAKGILVIIDEVQTGAGRTGEMFAYQHFGILPDIVTMAKGLGGGVPIGATLARGELARDFVPGDHGSTFGGNPLACAAAKVVLTRLKNGLLPIVKERGEYLHNSLLRLKKHRKVTDVRGKGLLQGVQLDPDRIKGQDVVSKMLGKRFLINCAGNNTLRLAPPYIITESEIDAATDALDEIMSM